MDEKTILKGILDSYPYPIVFVDTAYVIRFLNRYAKYYYYEERGYQNLIGKSLFDCHNLATSREKIQAAFEKMKKDGKEVYLGVNSRNQAAPAFFLLEKNTSREKSFGAKKRRQTAAVFRCFPGSLGYPSIFLAEYRLSAASLKVTSTDSAHWETVSINSSFLASERIDSRFCWKFSSSAIGSNFLTRSSASSVVTTLTSSAAISFTAETNSSG